MPPAPAAEDLAVMATKAADGEGADGEAWSVNLSGSSFAIDRARWWHWDAWSVNLAEMQNIVIQDVSVHDDGSDHSPTCLHRSYAPLSD